MVQERKFRCERTPFQLRQLPRVLHLHASAKDLDFVGVHC